MIIIIIIKIKIIIMNKERVIKTKNSTVAEPYYINRLPTRLTMTCSSSVLCGRLKKNQSAPRPSSIPWYGEKMSKRLGGIIPFILDVRLVDAPAGVTQDFSIFLLRRLP